MRSSRAIFVALLLSFAPLLAHAALTTGTEGTQAVPPDQCEQGVNWQARNCTAGMDPRQIFYQTDASCAQKRIGVTAYTSEMSIFNDAKCTGGPCDNTK